MIARSQVGAGLMGLLRRLESWKIDWQKVGDSYEAGDIRERADVDSDEANAVCSWIKDPNFGIFDDQKHVVALDLDIPAYLVPSSTEGHSHLYIDVPGGVEHEDYMELVALLGRIGVVEDGYAAVSLKRGFTDLRLPWVAKEPRRERPQSRCCRCLQEGPDIQEYVDQAAMEIGPMPLAEQVEDWIWKNEGTLNRQSGLFACTACYIAMGQPISPRGWTPPGPDSIQPLELAPLPKQPLVIPTVDGRAIF